MSLTGLGVLLFVPLETPDHFFPIHNPPVLEELKDGREVGEGAVGQGVQPDFQCVYSFLRLFQFVVGHGFTQFLLLKGAIPQKNWF